MTEAKKTKSVYETLRAINVSDHTEKKNGLTYLSWAWAWDTLMKYYPTASSEIHRDPNGRFWFDDGHTGWVEVSVTVEGITRSELFPIMDYKNNSIPADKITTRMASDSVQRALTKAIARHGLGLYVYAGEDLPPEEGEPTEVKDAPEKAQNQPKKAKKAVKKDAPKDEPKEEVKTEEEAITEAQSTMLRKICEKYPEESRNVLNEYIAKYSIPKNQRMNRVQAAGLMNEFLKRGLRL